MLRGLDKKPDWAGHYAVSLDNFQNIPEYGSVAREGHLAAYGERD